MIFLLLVAGHETTVNLIASGTLTLLLHAELRERLLADRSLLPGAIEELLRYVSPVNHATLRFTTAATPITGVTIPERQVVLLALSAANRDPSRFPAPDQADIGRDTSGHLAFGHGIHYCLGAPLARLEAEIAFGALLDAFPRMALAVPPESLRWRPARSFTWRRSCHDRCMSFQCQPRPHRRRQRGQRWRTRHHRTTFPVRRWRMINPSQPLRYP